MSTPESDATEDTRSVTARILAGSHIITALRRVQNAVRPRLRSAQSRVATIVGGSWLYRWLTAEPDPDVIVIDLRETWTVGPFVRILDWGIETIAPWYHQSTLKRGVDAAAAVATRAADTRPGRLLVELFEPPEPPTEDQRQHDDKDQD